MKAKDVMAMYDITRVTLSDWVKTGKINYEILPSGRYKYLVTESIKDEPERINVIYSRVSTSIQKDNLQRQTDRLRQFCSAKGYVVDEVFSDVASALNYNRKGYIKLFNLVINKKVAKIFIEYKDRMLRIGYDDFERLCKAFGTEIIVIDKSDKEKSRQQEITEDLISIIHHFSMRIYSSRKRKKIIDTINDRT